MRYATVLGRVAATVLLLLIGAPATADDAGLLSEADALVARMKNARTAKDLAEVSKALERVAPLHNEIQDPERRLQLQKRVGAVLRTKAFASLSDAALETLLALDDANGAYKQMRTRLPAREDRVLSEVGRQVLEAVAERPVDAALGRLKSLARKAHSDDVRVAAILTLGAYGGSAERVSILGFLLGLLARLRLEPRDAWNRDRIRLWGRVGPALLESACRLTGQQVRDPSAWMARYEQKPRDLGGLFDPAQPLAPPARPEAMPWRRMRDGLARPNQAALDAVEQALLWLATHQSPNGSWEAAGFDAWCDGKAQARTADSGHGNAIYDVGVTGLALNAFLVAGYDGAGGHHHDAAVRRALAWLVSVQDKEGCIGARVRSKAAQIEEYGGPIVHFRGTPNVPTPPTLNSDRATYIYNHAVAALALVEAYGLTGTPALRAPAQRGLDFIALARNPYFAWRYGIKPGDNDTSITAWMVLALGCAQRINAAHLIEMEEAPFTLDDAAFDGVLAWLQKVTDPDFGRVGYLQRGSGSTRLHRWLDRFPREKSEALTAAGICIRVLTGENARKSKIIKLGADLCAKLPPTWHATDGSVDMVYWHFGTLAMYAVGGKHWRAWQKALQKALVVHQRADTTYGSVRGSWDPIGPWGSAGGRVYATALNALTLLSPVRFPLSRR